MSSQRALDAQGRAIVVVTTPSLWLQVGERFLMLEWLNLFEPRGRPRTARERESTRARYDSSGAKRQRAQLVEVPDDELDEAAAVAAAYAEQRRTPPDLVNVATRGNVSRFHRGLHHMRRCGTPGTCCPA
jgi:hypothetical protein